MEDGGVPVAAIGWYALSPIKTRQRGRIAPHPSRSSGAMNVILLLLLSACGDRDIPILVNSWCDDPRDEVIAEVIDGDTIDLESGERLRLLGVDAPELYYSGHELCSSEESTECCYGDTAHQWLAETLPPGTTVRLEFDLDCEGIYGRTLAYLYLSEEDGETGESESLFINEELLKEGMARVYDADVEQAQDIRYIERFREAQLLAQTNGAGLWGECY